MKTLTRFLFMAVMAALAFSSCKKDDNNTPQPSPVPAPTTEQKITGYYWRCDSIQVTHYMNGNWIGYEYPHPSLSYLNLATNHTYTWDNSPFSSSGTWAVSDESHLSLDAIIYDIQLLSEHGLNLHGEKTWTAGSDVYTDKMYLYFSK